MFGQYNRKFIYIVGNLNSITCALNSYLQTSYSAVSENFMFSIEIFVFLSLKFFLKWTYDKEKLTLVVISNDIESCL